MFEASSPPAARFTVAICTRNRDSFLQLCLSGVLDSAGTLNFPIVVINNGSTDRTADVLRGFIPNITVINEPTIGLSVARNCALRNCKTEYIVYLDDDAIPSRSWVGAVIDITARSTVDIFGGPYSPFYTSPKPRWFDDKWGAGHPDLKDGLQPAPICFSGGNMGWRVSLLNEMGGFDPNLGMKGNALRLGEETALQVAIRNKHSGARFEFSGAMHMRHHVPSSKMTLRYIYQRNFTYGRQLKDIDPREFMRLSSLRCFLETSKIGLPLALRLLVRDRKRYPFWKTFAAEYLSLNSILLGAQWRVYCDRLSALRTAFGLR